VIEKNGGELLKEIENLVTVHTFIENGKWQAKDVEYVGEKWLLYWIELTHITLIKENGFFNMNKVIIS